MIKVEIIIPIIERSAAMVRSEFIVLKPCDFPLDKLGELELSILLE